MDITANDLYHFTPLSLISPPWAQSVCCRGQSYTFITAAPLGTRQCTQAGNRKVHIHHFHLQGTSIAHKAYVTLRQRNKHRHENHQVSRRKAWVWPPVCSKRPHKSGEAQPMQLFPRGMGELRSHLLPHCPTFPLLLN